MLFRSPMPVGAQPGTEIKDGLGMDKVPWTPAAIRQFCNERRIYGGHQFEWKTLLGGERTFTLGWNGIHYWVFAGVENKIPSPHYAVYMQTLEDQRREAARWQAPANPPTFDGYMSPPHQFQTVGPLEPRSET